MDFEAENAALREEVDLLHAKLIHCQEALDINKEIMQNALTMQNEVKESFSREIEKLKAQLAVLGGVTNGNLD